MMEEDDSLPIRRIQLICNVPRHVSQSIGFHGRTPNRLELTIEVRQLNERVQQRSLQQCELLRGGSTTELDHEEAQSRKRVQRQNGPMRSPDSDQSEDSQRREHAESSFDRFHGRCSCDSMRIEMIVAQSQLLKPLHHRLLRAKDAELIASPAEIGDAQHAKLRGGAHLSHARVLQLAIARVYKRQ